MHVTPSSARTVTAPLQRGRCVAKGARPSLGFTAATRTVRHPVHVCFQLACTPQGIRESGDTRTCTETAANRWGAHMAPARVNARPHAVLCIQEKKCVFASVPSLQVLDPTCTAVNGSRAQNTLPRLAHAGLYPFFCGLMTTIFGQQACGKNRCCSTQIAPWQSFVEAREAAAVARNLRSQAWHTVWRLSQRPAPLAASPSAGQCPRHRAFQPRCGTLDAAAACRGAAWPKQRGHKGSHACDWGLPSRPA